MRKINEKYSDEDIKFLRNEIEKALIEELNNSEKENEKISWFEDITEVAKKNNFNLKIHKELLNRLKER